jgi:hypothetical protein
MCWAYAGRVFLCRSAELNAFYRSRSLTHFVECFGPVRLATPAFENRHLNGQPYTGR